MDERRNLYRLLHLQPDAPIALVRANYRALMTKLERHPDLGGDHWNAACLGEAYTTLKDPKRRAAYDRELLEQYDLLTLSRGPAAACPPEDLPPPGVDPTGNQRNYYRVLGVQSDAPAPVLEAAFRALRASPRAGEEIALLEAAIHVLRDAGRRALYDEALVASGHARAGERAASEGESEEDPPAGEDPGPPPSCDSALALERDCDYQPSISSYCHFCMTPHGQRQPLSGAAETLESTALCRECASPLFSPPADLMALGRREIARVGRDDEAHLQIGWPEPRARARTIDLSPTGFRCATEWPIETGERVRVELSALCAVGEVAHHRRLAQPGGAITEAGIRFLAVAFAGTKGGFLATRG